MWNQQSSKVYYSNRLEGQPATFVLEKWFDSPGHQHRKLSQNRINGIALVKRICYNTFALGV
jgi:hypothetical protein